MVRMTEGLRESFRNIFEVQAYHVLNNSNSTSTSRETGLARSKRCTAGSAKRDSRRSTRLRLPW
jgi:hypothetical protein